MADKNCWRRCRIYNDNMHLYLLTLFWSNRINIIVIECLSWDNVMVRTPCASGSWTNFEFVLLNWVVFCRSFLFILLLVIVLSLWLMITPLVIFKLFVNFFPVWPVLKLYKFKTYYLPCGQAGFAWSTHHHVVSTIIYIYTYINIYLVIPERNTTYFARGLGLLQFFNLIKF
jgi:hypothetical protein